MAGILDAGAAQVSFSRASKTMLTAALRKVLLAEARARAPGAVASLQSPPAITRSMLSFLLGLKDRGVSLRALRAQQRARATENDIDECVRTSLGVRFAFFP